jgi:hypothetical protein
VSNAHLTLTAVMLGERAIVIKYNSDNSVIIKRKSMITKPTFAEILESADQLPLEDQENLIVILQNRLRERRRSQRIRDVEEAQKEFAEGKCQPITIEQLMQEILS